MQYLLRPVLGVLVGASVIVLFGGCGSQGGSTPHGAPIMVATPRLAPEAPSRTDALTFALMKQVIKPGMSSTQVRAALGTPYEDTGATMVADEQKYGRNFEQLHYVALDGSIQVILLNGRVDHWTGGPGPTLSRIPDPRAPEYQPPIGSKRLYLAPTAGFPNSLTSALVDYCKRDLKLSAHVLPKIPLPDSVRDRARPSQLVSERIIALLKRENQDLVNDPHVILIGLTQYNINTSHENLNFVFGTRDEGRFGVISTARMDPVYFGQPPNRRRLQTRAQKMLLRYIGMLYYEQPVSSDPKSVLYGSIGGLEDLDTLGTRLEIPSQGGG